MKAELQEEMNRLRRLQGAIDQGNPPAIEREKLAAEVADIIDALFEIMRGSPMSKPNTSPVPRSSEITTDITCRICRAEMTNIVEYCGGI